MSRNINVNPGNYKVAGRERQGEDISHETQKQMYVRQRTETDIDPRKTSQLPARSSRAKAAAPIVGQHKNTRSRVGGR